MDLRRPQLTFGPPSPLPGGDGKAPSAPDPFEEEMATLLQRRLRALVLFLVAIGTVFYGISAVTRIAKGAFSVTGEEFPLLVGCLVMGASLLLLRGARLSRRSLAALDAAALAVVAASLLFDYDRTYASGGERNLHYLGLVLVLRAVVVPSTALRTVLLSAPVALAYGAIQWLHARAGHRIGTNEPDWSTAADKGPFSSYWLESMLWDQVYLWIAIGMAALASRIHHTLRLRAFAARRLDRYVLEARIGEGAMGTVYRARHTSLARPVALKVVRPDLRGEAALRRFEQEILQTSRLTHPNAIAVYDCGVADDGSLYYAMEWIEGADLRRIVDLTGAMPAARVIHVLSCACGALAEAHAASLVHRDVKPDNVLLGERGGEWDVVKVMDFGLVADIASPAPGDEGKDIVRQTQVGDVVGTPETIAPECAKGGHAVPASDLYGLAATGYFLLAGRPVFDEASVLATLSAHASKPPRPPSEFVGTIPADLERVILRSLRKRPEDRHASADAFRADLLACADAGRWTRDDSAAWWRAHRATVLPTPQPTSSVAPTRAGDEGPVA